MLACTALLALFLGFGKRRHELAAARTRESSAQALEAYSPVSLNVALAVTGRGHRGHVRRLHARPDDARVLPLGLPVAHGAVHRVRPRALPLLVTRAGGARAARPSRRRRRCCATCPSCSTSCCGCSSSSPSCTSSARARREATCPMTRHARPISLAAKPGAWVDLGLTLPIFLVYQLGVVFLARAERDRSGHRARCSGSRRGIARSTSLITASIGVVFAGVFAAPRARAGVPAAEVRADRARGGPLRHPHAPRRGVRRGAALRGRRQRGEQKRGARRTPSSGSSCRSAPASTRSSRSASCSSASGPSCSSGSSRTRPTWSSGTAPRRFGSRAPGGLTWRGVLVAFLWALVSAAVFSGIHYVGALGDSFALQSFVFRVVLGLALTLIFVLRGFAAAVWTHALYDVWVLVLPGA